MSNQPWDTPPVVIHVTGDAAPKGSSRAILVAGRAVNIPSGSDRNKARQGAWTAAVVSAWADGSFRAGFPSGPVAVGCVFRRPLRSADLDSANRSDRGPKAEAPVAVTVKPDDDKLVRSTLDALTNSRAWGDDSRVTIVHAAKIYVPPAMALGGTIVIGALDPLTLDGMDQVHSTWRGELAWIVTEMAAARRATAASRIGRRWRTTRTGITITSVQGTTQEILPLAPPAPDDEFGDFGGEPVAPNGCRPDAVYDDTCRVHHQVGHEGPDGLWHCPVTGSELVRSVEVEP